MYDRIPKQPLIELDIKCNFQTLKGEESEKIEDSPKEGKRGQKNQSVGEDAHLK